MILCCVFWYYHCDFIEISVDPAAMPSADYNLAHYHQIVNHGLRAGVGRSRTINSSDSVGSFDVCGTTPGMYAQI